MQQVISVYSALALIWRGNTRMVPVTSGLQNLGNATVAAIETPWCTIAPNDIAGSVTVLKNGDFGEMLQGK